jgi:putative polyhydroxyalkanoate system protein
MSRIHIRRTHAKPLAEARKDAERMARQLKKDFELDYGWDGHVLRFERTGVEGELHVTAKEIRLDARLGFLLAFLKPRIEAEVEAILDKLLGPSGKTAAPAKHHPPARKPPSRRPD